MHFSTRKLDHSTQAELGRKRFSNEDKGIIHRTEGDRNVRWVHIIGS